MVYHSATKHTGEIVEHRTTSLVPPQPNFFAAANHVRNLFESKKISYSITGGLEMLCLGYRRDMSDIHIVYDDKDYFRLKKKLEADKRITLPDGMNPLFPFKMLVGTGPAYQDAGCFEVATIEVNMIPPGSCGSPPSGTLSNNIVLLSLKQDGRLKTFKGLSMLYMVRTMVHFCTAQDLAWNPREDVLYLCKNFSNQVQAIRAGLDTMAVQHNFLGTGFLARLSREDQRICYRVLLGKEPPPVMAITPPVPQYGHARAVSDYSLPKSRSNPRLSTPDMRKRTESALLSPPLPGTSKSTRSDSVITMTEPTEPSEWTRGPSESSAPKFNSRSRYRSVSATKLRTTGSKHFPPIEDVLQTASKPKLVVRQASAQYMPTTVSQVQQTSINGRDVGSTRTDDTTTSRPRYQADTSRCSRPLYNTLGCEKYSTEQTEHSSDDSNGLFRKSQTLLASSHGQANLAPTGSTPTSKTFELESTSYGNEAVSGQSGNDAISQLLEDPLLDEKKQQQLMRPTIPRVRSAPHDGVPSSLIAGQGATSHSHSRNASGNEMPELVQTYTGSIETNATRYSRYYSQPSSGSTSNASSPQLIPAPLNIYKAYKPDSTPLSLPLPSTDGYIDPANLTPLDDCNASQHDLSMDDRAQDQDPQRVNIPQSSTEFAQNYRAELPDYEDGYGAKR